MSKEVKILTVNGMSCEHCVKAIKGAAGGLNGVSSVDVNLDTKKVTVEFDPEKVTVALIKDAIEDQGYDVAE